MKKEIGCQYRQGDVLLENIPKPRQSALTLVKRGRIVIRLGESTGHQHVIGTDVDEDAVAEFITAEGRRVLWVQTPTELRHVTPADAPTKEHDQGTVQPGWYVIPEQLEYDPLRIARQVRD